MDFQLNEEHELIRQSARDFAQNELKPGVIERDDKQKFPAEQVKRMAELGFLGMMVDENMAAADWILFRMCWPWKKFRKWMLRARSSCR